jgi:regulator of sirC expression with transglutaminase-like and TPR domain
MFADAVRRDPVDIGLACLLIAHEADPGVDAGEVMATLDALADDTRPVLAELNGVHPAGPHTPPETPASDSAESTSPRTIRPPHRGEPGRALAGPAGLGLRAAAEALRTSLGLRAGFSGTAEDYDDLRASLLPTVLRRRHGLPILLSVVWLEVARRLGLPAYPVGLPGHIVVAIGSPAENVLVDPFAGGRLITVHEAAEKVRATGTAFTRAHLAPLPPVDLLTRVLTNIRVLAARADAPYTRLWAVDLSLLLPRHSAALRRERGEILVRVGDFLGGAAELATFADSVAQVEPAAAAAARQAALAARSRLN